MSDWTLKYGNDLNGTLVYVAETGKYYIRVDVGDVSYLFDVPDNTDLNQLVEGSLDSTVDWGEGQDLAIENQIRWDLKNKGQLETFQTEDEFDNAILSGDLRESLYVDASITNIAIEIVGGVDAQGNVIEGQGIDWLTDFIDQVEQTSLDAPWWNDPAYIDEVAKAALKWGAAGYENFKALGSFETGESHNDILKRLGYDPRTFDAWTEYSQDKDSFNAKVADYKLQIEKIATQKGGSLSDAAINYAANEWAWGRWSSGKTQAQVEKAIDEYALGDLDAGFAGVIGGEGFAKTTVDEDKIRTLIDTYVPQELKGAYEDKIAEHAGKSRNNPAYLAQLEEEMKAERFALYPQYDKNLSWSNIVAGKKSLAASIWGIDVANIKSDDPTILKLLKDNDPDKEGEILRQEGFKRNYGGVMKDFNRALGNAFGTGVVKSAGWVD